MHRARNFENPALVTEFNEEPRLVEVLWALQFYSQPARPKPWHEGQFISGYRGGLRAFTHDLIEDSIDLIGTRQMRVLGEVTYDREMASAVYNEIPWRERDLVEGDDRRAFDSALGDDSERLDPARFIEATPRKKRISEREIRTIVRKANRAAFEELCVRAARESLTGYLRNLCELPNVRFRRVVGEPWTDDDRAPWYFADVAEALLRFIDRLRAAAYRQIAETEVSRLVGKWLGRAHSTRRGVLISGTSRFGKTESVQTFCEAHPGRARLVQTPPSNSESDLLRAVAKSFGMEIGPKQRGYQLREEIGYLVDQAGLMLVFDEAQGIFPASFGRNTTPTRLNWIRRSVLDCGVPAAFICTPQSYQNARRKFLRATNFSIEQWDERLLQTVHLPEEVPHEDLLAIARIRFPTLYSEHLKFLVNAVKLTERNYVSDISRIADLARLNAGESGRDAPNLADIKAAIADVLPATKTGAGPPAEELGKAASSNTNRSAAGQPDAVTSIPGRAVTAALPWPGRRTNWDRSRHRYWSDPGTLSAIGHADKHRHPDRHQ